MKKSNILQINNEFIQNELQKRRKNDDENRQKTRFMGLILVLAIFLFILPTYNLVESYNTLKDKEKQLVKLEERYQELTRQEKLESSLVTKLKDEEYAGYYCLVLAIVCGLNAAEAWKIYQYGPDHPLSKKILKHKIRDSSLKKLKKKEQEKMMKKLFLEGYSKNAIAEAFECLPETVTARIKRAEEDTNGT